MYEDVPLYSLSSLVGVPEKVRYHDERKSFSFIVVET